MSSLEKLAMGGGGGGGASGGWQSGARGASRDSGAPAPRRGEGGWGGGGEGGGRDSGSRGGDRGGWGGGGGWSGGGVQFSPDSFRIQYRQFGTTRYAANIQIMAYHEGDATYKYAEQAGQIKFPDKNKEGEPQTITFPEIGEISKATKSYDLKAVSSVGLPIYYYIKEGPAIVKDNQLLLDGIPPRAKFPIKLTIVAWQYGRGIAPLIKTATPVEQVVYMKE